MERAEEMDFTWESPGKLGIALQQSVDGPRLKSVDCPDKPRLRPGMALIAIQVRKDGRDTRTHTRTASASLLLFFFVLFFLSGVARYALGLAPLRAVCGGAQPARLVSMPRNVCIPDTMPHSGRVH
eukprot:COSAG02_NODE_459_length_21908_cov_5.444725_5_plen_126_part_00